MFPYSSGEDGRKKELFDTPKEVMDDNIRRFRDMVESSLKTMKEKMYELGYVEEQTKRLLGFKI